MGILLTDDTKQSELSARVLREVRAKMMETSGEGDAPDIPDDVDLAENSAYMEEFTKSEKNPYFGRIILLILILAAIIAGFWVVL